MRRMTWPEWMPYTIVLIFMMALISSAEALENSLLEWEQRQRKTLVGLTGVGVSVEVKSVKSDAETEGLAPSTLRTDVELRLRQSGIRVLTDPDDAVKQGTLQLIVRTVKSEHGFYAFHIDLKLWQLVTLIRDPSIASAAPTWSTGDGGFIGNKRLSEIRDRVRDMVDRFINAYLAANPKR